MKYSIDKEEKYSIFTLNEEKLDSSIAPALKSEFITLHAEGVRNLVLDMSPVKYCDSSGLSSLLVANRAYTQEGGMFVLTGLNDHVQKLVTISQLDSVLTILPTVEEGVDTVFMNEIENDLKSENGESNDDI